MIKKKGRYWIFAFDGYYPKGGMNDYCFSFNTIEEFEEEALKMDRRDGYQLLDTDTHYHFQSDLITLTKWICKNVEDGECEYE